MSKKKEQAAPAAAWGAWLAALPGVTPIAALPPAEIPLVEYSPAQIRALTNALFRLKLLQFVDRVGVLPVRPEGGDGVITVEWLAEVTIELHRQREASRRPLLILDDREIGNLVQLLDAGWFFISMRGLVWPNPSAGDYAVAAQAACALNLALDGIVAQEPTFAPPSFRSIRRLLEEEIEWRAKADGELASSERGA